MLTAHDILIASATRRADGGVGPTPRTGGPSASDDLAVSAWVGEAAARAGRIGANKFAELSAWMRKRADAGLSIEQIRNDLSGAFPAIRSDDEIELNQQVILAAELRGRVDTALRAERRAEQAVSGQQSALSHRDPLRLPLVKGERANGLTAEQPSSLTAEQSNSLQANSLFADLPFTQAIEALVQRLAMPKEEFERLRAAARSRAFTMARVADQNILENIHDELSQAITDGETYRDFEKRLRDVQERTGWTGSEPWHYRLVYDMNAGMAYSAGRYEQGIDSGLAVWRYLPSLADEPRIEHTQYYNQLFRAAPGSPMPPIDFNCACGWEWVFNEELEAMGIDPASVSVFSPPVPSSGFVWSASDYLPHVKGRGAVGEGRGNERMEHELTLTACQQVDVAAAPSRVLLVPWGGVQSTSGDFEVDYESAAAMLQEFLAHGTDLPIDYEHQTLGGEYSSPSGEAPAAGWVRKLEPVPGEGIYGIVDWTQRGRQRIASKEYRYLSPVVGVRRRDMKAMTLHSAALTNKPAIVGMAAIMNKQSAASGSELSADERTDSAASDDADFSERILIMKKLSERARQIATSAGLSAEQKLTGVLKLLDDEPEPQANKATDFGPALLAVAGELGDDGKAVVEAVGKGDVEAAQKGLVMAVNRAKSAPGKVDAEQYNALKGEVQQLRDKIAADECESLIQANSTKLPPSKTEWFKKFFARDPDGAREWMNEAPEIVVNKATAKTGDGAGGLPDRAMLINSSRAKFRDESERKHVLCSERAWVNNALREAGQSALSEDETRTMAIAIA